MTDFFLDDVSSTSIDVTLADRGQPGPPGAGATYVHPAGVALGGQRAVKIVGGQVLYCDATTPADGPLLAGLTAGAASPGAACTVVAAGELSDVAWTWSPGPVFVGASGLLTQSTAGLSWVRQVAVATSPTALLVSIGPLINL